MFRFSHISVALVCVCVWDEESAFSDAEENITFTKHPQITRDEMRCSLDMATFEIITIIISIFGAGASTMDPDLMRGFISRKHV